MPVLGQYVASYTAFTFFEYPTYGYMLLPALTALYGIIAAGSMLLRLTSVAATYSCYAFPPMYGSRVFFRTRVGYLVRSE
jgi:hypothetical protein